MPVVMLLSRLLYGAGEDLQFFAEIEDIRRETGKRDEEDDETE